MNALIVFHSVDGQVEKIATRTLNAMPTALFRVSLISAGEGERSERLAHGLVDELLAAT